MRDMGEGEEKDRGMGMWGFSFINEYLWYFVFLLLSTDREQVTAHFRKRKERNKSL